MENNFLARLRPLVKKGDDNGNEYNDDNADPDAFTPLAMLMENSVLIPLRTQLQLVNQAVLGYLLEDAGVMDHLKAMRNYLLFHDGEFAHHVRKNCLFLSN